ncbi:MAG: HAD family hydrolase [Proteobacteria bacterium]|nr:HAD family hydrolase [Pseudomonadota bacterium]MBU1736835.1 HAD family hydrolase [Pseudomonadota bacterium]
MEIQCIHFDLDSVLYIPATFLKNTLGLAVKTMIEHGLRAEPAEALHTLREIRSVDSNAGDHFDRLCKFYNGVEDPIIIASGVEKYWDCKSGNMMAAPGAYSVLEALSHTYRLTIVSNGRPVKQAAKLVRLDLARFFTFHDPDRDIQLNLFYATDDPARAKPYPYLWEQAQRERPYSFEKALMVGDRYWADILGAKLLGMTTVKIQQGEHRHETIEDAYRKNSRSPFLSGSKKDREEILAAMIPDFTIETLQELPAVIEQLTRNI